MKVWIRVIIALFCSGALYAESDSTITAWSRFSLRGYGIINYYAFTWETDPDKRNAIDVERLVLYPSYQLNENVRFNGEIEFEHGGTGSTMEFDKFEEFGEYESEVEKGGEVVIEQLNIEYAIESWLNLRGGRIKVPIGVMQKADEPHEYFTTTRSEAESALVPSLWYENGIEVFGNIGALRYQAMVVNGLDATGFSSGNWIAGGHQMRFEMVNAEDLAYALRVDYEPRHEHYIGASAYFGNTTHNRPKPDLKVDAQVALLEAHAVLRFEPIRFRTMIMYGTLSNADAVSYANRNLSNNLNVKRTPVGSAAMSWFVEAGYNVFSLLDWSPAMDVFARYEYYDTMAKVEGNIFDNPRWERRVITAGINYRPSENMTLKGEYSFRTLGIATHNIERTASVGMGLEF